MSLTGKQKPVVESSFEFQLGGQRPSTKTNCKHWGTVKHKWLIVPGCILKYEWWCRNYCMTCSDYEKKREEVESREVEFIDGTMGSF